MFHRNRASTASRVSRVFFTDRKMKVLLDLIPFYGVQCLQFSFSKIEVLRVPLRPTYEMSCQFLATTMFMAKIVHLLI